MTSAAQKGWTPPIVGSVAAILAVLFLIELLSVPVGQGEFFLLGTVLTGSASWMAAASNIAILAMLAYGAFQRVPFTVWVVMAYCAFWAANAWIFSWLYIQHSNQSRVLTAGLVTVLLAVVARRVQLNWNQFDR